MGVKNELMEWMWCPVQQIPAAKPEIDIQYTTRRSWSI